MILHRWRVSCSCLIVPVSKRFPDSLIQGENMQTRTGTLHPQEPDRGCAEAGGLGKMEQGCRSGVLEDVAYVVLLQLGEESSMQPEAHAERTKKQPTSNQQASFRRSAGVLSG